MTLHVTSQPDDWRAETLDRLNKSGIFKCFKGKCDNDPAGTEALHLVSEATYYAYQRTKSIVRHMGEFTLHDGDHLFRVLHLMERLLPDSELRKLSIPELILLILSAFFHDIGMAPNESQVLAWRKVWDAEPKFADEKEEAEFQNFLRFCKARPDKEALINRALQQGDFTTADSVKNYLVTDYIRITHAERAKEIVQTDWSEKIRYRDLDLTVEFSNICFSHNEDAVYVLSLDQNLLCGPNVYACLPLVATILRLADILDFDAKRTPEVLFSHLFVRHPISVAEWNKHRSIQAWEVNNRVIQFHAKCSHPAIEASIRKFCDYIDHELAVANHVFSVLNEFHRDGREISLRLPLKVDRSKIETKKGFDNKPIYIYKETQFNLSKSQVIDLLMGTKLYGDPSVALRELLQNSIDACLLRVALEREWGGNYIPAIKLRYFQEGGDDVLEVDDNGTGMDQYIVDSYYSKVGSSFYKSADFYELKSASRATFTPTSRFGIGILSCFMVADTLNVETRRVYGPHNSSSPLNITVEGQESLFYIKPGKRQIPGTTTRLVLRKGTHPWDRMTSAQFIESVRKTVRNPPFPITVISGEEKIEIDQYTFGQTRADSLKENSWAKHDNVREFSIDLTDSEAGLAGSALVALLEEHSLPVADIDVNLKTVEIDGKNYDLQKKIALSGTEIRVSATSISIDETGDDIKSNSYSSGIVRSSSRLSLHGIEIATTLFPQSWMRQANQAAIDWAFPMLIVLDVCGANDLDLNSARTQILLSDKWLRVEEKIAEKVCREIRQQVSSLYWRRFKEVILGKSKSAVFDSVLSRFQ